MADRKKLVASLLGVTMQKTASRKSQAAGENVDAFAWLYVLAIGRYYQKTICAGHGEDVTGALPAKRGDAWGCARRWMGRAVL